jgi:metal-dependent amidase/aminoacylase/carboxypeptidase family protein
MDAKSGAREKFKTIQQDILALSHRIHAHPELGFEEEKACGWLADSLDHAGFQVQRGVAGLETAFIATAGHGPLHIGICAEYDSLPEIGHACGHNMIAAMAVGAAIAAAHVADDAGLTISVFGTPAEEVGNASGKVLMLERDAFDGVHAAMMVHPAPFEMVEAHLIAASMFDVHYTGKEAHASAFPELGINAADALTVAQTAIGLLRQHIRQTDRVHGITTHGGDAPNVVPAHTSARYLVRAELEIRGGDKPYADVRYDREISLLYKKNAETLGRAFPDLGPIAQRLVASTDMGNLSHAIPSIHPMIGINSMPASNHQPEFTAHCVKAEADKAVLDGSLAMAWTAIDIAQTPSLRARLTA